MAFSITIANAASSDLTLIAMTIIACIGVPLVLVYHVISYRIFSGNWDAYLTQFTEGMARLFGAPIVFPAFTRIRLLWKAPCQDDGALSY